MTHPFTEALKDKVVNLHAKLPEGFAFAVTECEAERAEVTPQQVIDWLRPEEPFCVMTIDGVTGNLIVWRKKGLTKHVVILNQAARVGI
jgi:hypothetical protein